MKHTFSRSFATRLSIYVLSFTLIVFTTIMVLAYNYSQEKVTNYAIERTHGLLNNMVTEISSQLSSVKTTVNQSLWMLEGGLNHPDSLRHIITEVVKNNPFIVGSAAGIVVGPEECSLEAPGRIDLLGILAFGVGKGAQHAGYGRRQAPGSLHLLFQLLACEVTQRIVRRAPRTQRSDILTVVIAVQQPHRVGIGPVHPFEDLPDDGLGIETLGVGIERILLQPGYQTIIIRREHSVTP